MKIVFLALNNTFDFSQIGGTDSYMRRLINSVLEFCPRAKITCCFYGSDRCEQNDIKPRLESVRVHSFHDALQYLSALQPDNVIATYIHPRDRLTFAWFRKLNKDIRFHNIVFFYPQGRLKRYIKFLEYWFCPYNGKLFCVSNRQYDSLKAITDSVVYLPPIIPEDYFVDIGDKEENQILQVTFLGRLDPHKGIKETIKLFDDLRCDKRFNCTIYGIHIRSDVESYRMHQWLNAQDKIKYIEVDRKSYSTDTEQMVKNVLRQTDIFVQPYATLDSTVDAPLLLLEAMASLCLVLSTAVGDVSTLYGNSSYVLEREKFIAGANTLLKSLSLADLHAERKRIMQMPILKEVRSGVIVKRFLNECG